MNHYTPISDFDINILSTVLSENTNINWKTISIDDLDQFKFPKTMEQDYKKDSIVFALKAYQRLLRILPEKREEFAIDLLKQNIHSAIQIANMPKSSFKEVCHSIIPDEAELIDQIYENALNKRSVLLLHYMNVLQNNEPHYRATRC